jgi:hypothetical protein
MPWWAWVWAGVIILWTLAAAWDDWNNGQPIWEVLLSVATGAWCVVSIRAYFVAAVRSRLGRVMLPASLLALTWVVVVTAVEMLAFSPDSRLSPLMNRVVSVIATALVVLVLGLPLSVGMWKGQENW